MSEDLGEAYCAELRKELIKLELRLEAFIIERTLAWHKRVARKIRQWTRKVIETVKSWIAKIKERFGRKDSV